MKHKKPEATLAILLIASAIAFIFALSINSFSPTDFAVAVAKIQCQDKIDNDYDNLTDYPADPGCSSRFDNDESDDIDCIQNWICTPWSDCLNDQQTRICTDEAQCQEKLSSQEVNKTIERPRPSEEQTCILPPTEPQEQECLRVSDCPGSHTCVDNNCILIPIEREPKKVFKFISTLFKKLISTSINFIKINYGSFIILILSAAVLVAGYFAYRSFAAGDYVEHWKERRIEKEKIRQKQEKAQQKQEKIRQKQEETQQKTEKIQERTQTRKELEPLSRELSYFIRDALLAGYNARQVKKSLLLKGWPKKITETYVSKIYQSQRKTISQIQESKILKKEMQQLSDSLKKPKEGIKFYQKPQISKEELPLQSLVIKPKPVKETNESKLLREEKLEIEKNLQKPSTKIKSSQKIPSPSKTSLEKLKEDISALAKKDKTKKQIIQRLVKENWPEDFVLKTIQKYFPRLEHISFFKKEVTAFENVLKKLKQR